jgi:hypothetical protein
MPEPTATPLAITLTAPIEVTTTVTTTTQTSEAVVDSIHIRPSDAAPWLAIRLTNGREIRIEGDAYATISTAMRPGLTAALEPHIIAALTPAPAPDPAP